MSSSETLTPRGGPYRGTTAGLGGAPTRTLDDPILAVFLVLFLIGAICHMTILQVNLKRGHKFIMSGMLFGFCMARITACTMRLVWSTHLSNLSVAIASQIFVAAGVLLLFIINIIFVQRILRASYDWAWSKPASIIFKIYYASIVAMLVALITAVVQSFYTLDSNIRRIDHDIQLVGATYFAVAAFLPLILLSLLVIIPKKTKHVDKFGQGRFRTKVGVLIFTSTILTLGAAFRAGTSYVQPSAAHPAWYDSKACFYLFDFTIEIIVVYTYAAIRVDRRFHIPNGARGYGSYGVGGKPTVLDRINSEEEVFDDPHVVEKNQVRSGDLEAGNRPTTESTGETRTEREKLETTSPPNTSA